MSVRDIARVVNGEVFHENDVTRVTGVAADTRRIQQGDAFVAFRGTASDGHAYISSAFDNGSVAAIVTDPTVVARHALHPLIVVRDPLHAVQALASFERQRFEGPVIGVTGSNGKTTTKDMLATVFSTAGECLATQGNFNTELGLPLTILGRTASHRFMILEMGMRGLGQIADLCEIASPTAGVITNIGTSHLELLGSQSGIAEAKGELLSAIPVSGYAALWAEDPWLQRIADRCRGRVLWYGMETGDATATNVCASQSGITFDASVLGNSTSVFLPTFGQHNVRNALSALLLGAAYGLKLTDMAAALSTLPSSSGRLHIVRGPEGRQIIDDCYNASPLSMRASLDVLLQVAGPGFSVAVLGDMFELGSAEEEGHTEVGRYVAERSVDCLVAIGPKSAWTARAAEAAGCRRVYYYSDKEEALHQVADVIPPEATVLVKASRGMKLEDLVQVLLGTSTTAH